MLLFELLINFQTDKLKGTVHTSVLYVSRKIIKKWKQMPWKSKVEKENQNHVHF